MSRLQFTTGAGHRRGRACQTRPMRSRRPPCRRQLEKESARVAPPRIAARAACRVLATPREEVRPKARRTKLAITYISEGCKPGVGTSPGLN